MLDWRGEQVARAAMRAVTASAEAAVDRAVDEARSNTPRDTGAAAESLERETGGARIVWGYHVRYGIFIEIGDRGRAGRHALRRAADSHYAEIVPGAASRFGT